MKARNLRKDVSNRKIIILETLDKNEKLLSNMISIEQECDKLYNDINFIKDISTLNSKQKEIINNLLEFLESLKKI